MVAESPARPPPTTMIFGLAIRFEISKSGNFEIESRRSSSWFSNYPITKLHNCEIPSLHLLSFHLSCRCRIGTPVAPLRFLGGNERPHRYHANHNEQDSNRETDYARFTPRLLTGDNSPFGTKQPYPISKVPGGADDGDHVNRQHPGICQFLLHFAETGARILEQSHSGEAQVINMLDDVGKSNDAGPALRRVHPIPCPWIRSNIGAAAIPDKNAVKRVIEDGYIDKDPFQPGHEWQRIQELDLRGIRMRTVGGVGI